MNVILNYFIEANLGLVLFYCFYNLVLNEETSFAFNRTYLLGSIFISLLFPLITIGSASPLPTMSSVIPSYYLPELVVTGEGVALTEAETPAAQAVSFWTIIKWVYLIGLVFLLLRFILQVGKLVWRIQSYTFTSINGSGKVIETNTPHPTFSFFNYIFIGNLNELSEEEKNQVICHELVHAKKMHSIDILLIEILRIVFWFNPLIKNYKHSIIMVHEFQADADNVADGDSEKYCNLLARVALLSADFKLANQFTNSLTLKRIKMLNAMKNKISTWKLAALVPAVVGFFFVVACQDQVMSEMSKVAENSTMAVEYPTFVKQKLKEMQQQFPDAKFTVVELNDEGKATLNNLEEKYGMPTIMGWFPATEDASDKRTFAIFNFDENAKKVADLSQDGEEVFTIVEQSAMPTEGMDEFYVIIGSAIQYPTKAIEMGIEGKVFVQFIVEKDGSLSDFQIMKGIGAGCDEEAVRILSQSKPWNPGKQRGHIVRQRMVIPIFFSLTGNTSNTTSVSSLNLTDDSQAVSTNVQKSAEGEDVFTRVEESATYPGGMEKFYSFFNDNYIYPAQAKKMGIEGKVFVQFVVKKDGVLSEFQIMKGIGAGCDEEVMRIMALSKPWKPGKQRGQNVNQRLVIPVFFKL